MNALSFLRSSEDGEEMTALSLLVIIFCHAVLLSTYPSPVSCSNSLSYHDLGLHPDDIAYLLSGSSEETGRLDDAELSTPLEGGRDESKAPARDPTATPDAGGVEKAVSPATHQTTKVTFVSAVVSSIVKGLLQPVTSLFGKHRVSVMPSANIFYVIMAYSACYNVLFWRQSRAPRKETDGQDGGELPPSEDSELEQAQPPAIAEPERHQTFVQKLILRRDTRAIGRLRSKLNQVKLEKKDVSGKLKEAQQDLKKFNKDVEALKKSVERVREEGEKAKKGVEDEASEVLQKQIEAARALESSKDDEIERLEGVIDGMGKEIDEKDLVHGGELDEMKREIRELKGSTDVDANEMKEILEETEESLKRKDEEIEELKCKLEELTNAADASSEGGNDEGGESYAELKEKAARVEERYAELKEKAAQAEEGMEGKDGEIEELKRKVEELTKAAGTSSEGGNDDGEAYAELKEKAARAEESMKARDEEVAKLKEREEEMKQIVDSLSASMDESETTITVIKASLSKLEGENEILKLKLEQKQKEVVEMDKRRGEEMEELRAKMREMLQEEKREILQRMQEIKQDKLEQAEQPEQPTKNNY